MARFIALRDRDAWGIIRGYVYQVDLTVERWLNLPDDHVLELERGEDIDLVAQAIYAPDENEGYRLLEQVKHRDQPLTLRTPAAIEAIANAVAHHLANPDLVLRFRYTTNARVVCERPPILPEGIPAITAWEQLGSGTYSFEAQPLALTNIRSYLKNARQPADLPQEVWDIFHTFVRDADEASLLAFICTFEWSTGADDTVQLDQHIRELLIENRYAADLHEAVEIHQHLFFAVFKLLSQRGLKRLTVQDRSAHIARPLLGDEDRALLRTVVSVLNDLAPRLRAVEQQTEQHSSLLIGLTDDVQQLIRDQGIDFAVRYTIDTPVLEAPPLEGLISRRRRTVADLQQRTTGYRTYAL